MKTLTIRINIEDENGERLFFSESNSVEAAFDELSRFQRHLPAKEEGESIPF